MKQTLLALQSCVCIVCLFLGTAILKKACMLLYQHMSGHGYNGRAISTVGPFTGEGETVKAICVSLAIGILLVSLGVYLIATLLIRQRHSSIG